MRRYFCCVRHVFAVSATMDMTADSHRSWYDSAGRDETDSQLSVAEHMSSLFAHHHASLDSQSRDYHHRTVTVTSRYYQHQLQHSPYASHGEFCLPTKHILNITLKQTMQNVYCYYFQQVSYKISCF